MSYGELIAGNGTAAVNLLHGFHRWRGRKEQRWYCCMACPAPGLGRRTGCSSAWAIVRLREPMPRQAHPLSWPTRYTTRLHELNLHLTNKDQRLNHEIKYSVYHYIAIALLFINMIMCSLIVYGKFDVSFVVSGSNPASSAVEFIFSRTLRQIEMTFGSEIRIRILSATVISFILSIFVFILWLADIRKYPFYNGPVWKSLLALTFFLFLVLMGPYPTIPSPVNIWQIEIPPKFFRHISIMLPIHFVLVFMIVVVIFSLMYRSLKFACASLWMIWDILWIKHRK